MHVFAMVSAMITQDCRAPGHPKDYCRAGIQEESENDLDPLTSDDARSYRPCFLNLQEEHVNIRNKQTVEFCF